MARRETPPRERILLAAHTEFAERGLAGARVDTIARSAEASKERLYAHFATKRDLFDAALGASVDRWVAAVPFDARDLSSWASRLYLHFSEHVDDARLLLWGQIEGVTLASPGAVDHAELEARRQGVRDAQATGIISSDWRSEEVLTMTFGLVLSWFVTPVTTNVHLEDTARRALVVGEAVQRLLATGPLPRPEGDLAAT
ncbi:TetR family transcriptional regulator [Frondihabitans peucedani]|uniref:HTH tetR-type domain-containing protein n=1 Tax=Frondihabitans peucedani TaxID=598626 RepID=A0ABP8E071_9MICO